MGAGRREGPWFIVNSNETETADTETSALGCHAELE